MGIEDYSRTQSREKYTPFPGFPQGIIKLGERTELSFGTARLEAFGLAEQNPRRRPFQPQSC